MKKDLNLKISVLRQKNSKQNFSLFQINYSYPYNKFFGSLSSFLVVLKNEVGQKEAPKHSVFILNQYACCEISFRPFY